MKQLRRQTKSDILLNMFQEIGISIKTEDVLEITGIRSYGSLRSFLTYIRKSKHVADENRINIRIEDGFCVRREG